MIPNRALESNADESPEYLTLASLIRLRWGATLLQLAIIFVAVVVFKADVPREPLFGVVLLTAGSNLAVLIFRERLRTVAIRVIQLLLVLDVLLLTALLHWSGGPTNPFSILYLVHVVMAAVILGSFWAWAIAALSMLCFALLFVLAAPDALLPHHQPGAAGFNFHLQGMWVAFAIAAALVAHFLGRLTAALRDREQRLRQMERFASQQDRLAALTNLAAGAAHELGSPLSTIAIVAGEVSRGIERGVDAAEMRTDIDLIRAEVGRCKTILEQMSGRSGEVLGEMPQRTDLAEIYNQLVEALALNSPEQLQLRNHIGDRVLELPIKGLVGALKGLVKNALESIDSTAPAPVRLTVTDEGEHFAFIVSDYGSGIPSEVLARIGEPFFTTKEPGRGMGLGIFLARLFAERLGGSLNMHSAIGVGTTVTIVIPKPN